MIDDRTRAQKEALDAKIAAAKQAGEPKRHQDEHYSQAHLAWRMVIELVAGIVIGFGIGLGLDTLFETRPIFLVVFVLLGFAAGVKTMMRSAREIQDARLAEAADQQDEGD